MDEKTRQIIEDSEKIRGRNRALEDELHDLKVENERLKEENETLFATQGGVDPQNLRDALKWLHGQGGIGAVYSRYKDIVLSEEDEALNVLYSEDIEKRLMPGGMEWPRFEDGTPVAFEDLADIDGDIGSIVRVIVYSKEDSTIGVPGYSIGILANGYVKHSPPESFSVRVKRPAPKVLDADGVEIRVGDTVYRVDALVFDPEYSTLTVTKIRTKPGLTPVEAKNSHDGYTYGNPSDFTHRAPVLASDGKPLREGETVWDKDTGDRFEVSGFSEDGFAVCWDLDKCEGDIEIKPSQLIHERPDSWERLEEDASNSYCNYWGCDGIPCYDCPAIVDGKKPDERYDAPNCSEAVKSDLVRRAKALAERGV